MPRFHRNPVGSFGPNYRPGSKKDKHERSFINTRTPEQKAASIALVDGIVASMERTPAERGIEKLKDREARVAVEGDTDMNHDNVEAAE